MDAAAFRVHGISKIFSDHHCQVEFAGWEERKHSYIYDGNECHPQKEFNDGRESNVVKRIIGFIFRGFKTFGWIRDNNRFDLYILYNPPALFALIMFFWSKFSGKKVALDITEWYESSHLLGGKYGLVAIENWMRMKISYPIYDNIIVISTFLENYFRSKGCRNVVKCYPISLNNYDESLGFGNELDNCNVEFIYAGQPGKKDLLIDFIRKLPELEVLLKKKVLFHLIGPLEDEFRRFYTNEGFCFDDVKSHLCFHGFLKRDKVFELYQKADFSVLFRNNKRYARAGFPTKGMESLVNGCPIVLNDIGDISSIVKDINGGIISEPDDTVTLAELIANQKFIRGDIARRAAIYFGKEQYIKIMNDFIKGVSSDQHRN